MITSELDAINIGTSDTYNSFPSVLTATSLDVRLGSSDPSVGASSVNQKRVCNQSVPASTTATDTHTGCWRTPNINLSSVSYLVVCDGESGAAFNFAETGRLLHGLGTSAVLLNYAEDATLLNCRRKTKGGLAATTIERTRVHGGQRDQYQRKERFRREHGRDDTV